MTGGGGWQLVLVGPSCWTMQQTAAGGPEEQLETAAAAGQVGPPPLKPPLAHASPFPLPHPPSLLLTLIHS